jgi:FkbM family methyltransferase
MDSVNVASMPADLKALRCLFKLAPRGHRVARSLWSPRLRALGVVSVPTPLGFTLLVRLTDVMGWALAMHPNYEGPVTSLIAHHLRAGGTFADIGANHGWFSLYAAKLLRPTAGRVFAFEPQADMAALIRMAASLNGLENLTVIEAAAADRASRGVLRSDGEGNSGFVGAEVTDRLSDPIQVTTLDQELEQATPSVMKIDVEGGELRVLWGMGELLTRPALSCVIVEVHPEKMARLGENPEQLLSLLRAHRFRTYLISMKKHKGPLPELQEVTTSLPQQTCWNLLARR